MIWKQKLKKELDDLSEFDYNNKSKIKNKPASADIV